MSVATTTALAIGGIAAAGIGAAGSAIAGQSQAHASMNAAQLQAQSQQNSLGEQQREFNTQQKNLAPWLQAGTQGVNSLSSLLSTPGQGLLTPFSEQFQAPTAEQARATPGYQFMQDQGNQAIQNSAAARGGLLSGNTLQAMDQYSQGLADTTYSQTYNRALGEYQQRYNVFQGNQSNEFNRLASLSGVGQTAANTLGQLGQENANAVGNINATAGQQIGNSLQNAGAARASGYAGITNAITGGISNISQYQLLNQLLNQGGNGGGGGAGVPYNANSGMYDPGYTTS
jgi:hypothetical protein